MAEIMFPLENTDYSASDAQLWFATRLSGVYAGEHLEVSAADGMAVTVGKGIAWLNYGEFAGAVFGLTAEKVCDIGVSDANYPRIDRIVIRYDAIKNHGLIAVLAGVPASTPSPKALTRNENAYEISLAQIYVGAGATEITPENITDERLDESVCGLMRDGVTGIDTNVIHSQAMAAVESVKTDSQAMLDMIRDAYNSAIDGTLAGDLQIQVNKKAEKYEFEAQIGTTWEGTGPFTQTITVAGLLESDKPTIDVLTSTDMTTAKAELKTWGAIYHIATADDSITVYSTKASTQAITVQILGVR